MLLNHDVLGAGEVGRTFMPGLTGGTPGLALSPWRTRHATERGGLAVWHPLTLADGGPAVVLRAMARQAGWTELHRIDGMDRGVGLVDVDGQWTKWTR